MQGTSCLSGLNHGNSGNIDDLVGLGLIDERIVNRPGAGHSSNLGSNNNYQVCLPLSDCPSLNMDNVDILQAQHGQGLLV